MSEQQKSTAITVISLGQMVTAETIRTNQRPETATDVGHVRTVTTSLTTGNLSLRYVPRPSQPNNADTNS